MYGSHLLKRSVDSNNCSFTHGLHEFCAAATLGPRLRSHSEDSECLRRTLEIHVVEPLLHPLLVYTYRGRLTEDSGAWGEGRGMTADNPRLPVTLEIR